MSYTLLLLLIITLPLLAWFIHNCAMAKIYDRIHTLTKGKGSKSDLYEEMHIPQGDTFNFVTISAWILLLLSVAYFFFLTPSIFPGFNYFKVLPMLASSPLGFFFFGLLIILLASILTLNIPKLYGFYWLSGGAKKAIGLTLFLLGASIIDSAQLGIIYPDRSSFLVEALPVAAILISEIILLWPIFRGSWEAMR